jgi:hypothetical protein
MNGWMDWMDGCYACGGTVMGVDDDASMDEWVNA